MHADGEIWVQTLMDLRRRLVAELGEDVGGAHAESLVTRGMDMAPEEPSFLEVRDAMLLADQAAGGTDVKAIWEVFAHRGMGVKAKSEGGNDPDPTADFTVPAGLPNRPRPDSAAPRLTAVRLTRVKGGRVLVTGKATDDVAVSRVTVDGKRVRLVGGRFRITVKVRGGRVVVRAYDATGKMTRVVRRPGRAASRHR